jgi:hypothetical protein
MTISKIPSHKVRPKSVAAVKPNPTLRSVKTKLMADFASANQAMQMNNLLGSFGIGQDKSKQEYASLRAEFQSRC